MINIKYSYLNLAIKKTHNDKQIMKNITLTKNDTEVIIKVSGNNAIKYINNNKNPDNINSLE
jgi:hypothetical protein